MTNFKTVNRVCRTSDNGTRASTWRMDMTTYPEVAGHFPIIGIVRLIDQRESFGTDFPLNVQKMRELHKKIENNKNSTHCFVSLTAFPKLGHNNCQCSTNDLLVDYMVDLEFPIYIAT